MKTKKLVMNALLIAMHVVLCYFQLNFGNMKINFAGLPIIVGALLFGPVSGMSIGLIGSFMNQMLTYGITATTVLWILPAGTRGLLIGLYAKKKNYKLSTAQMTGIVMLTAFLVTIMNTATMYIDSKIYGYYSFAYVFGAVIPRFIMAIITSIAYVAVVPLLMKPLWQFKFSATPILTAKPMAEKK